MNSVVMRGLVNNRTVAVIESIRKWHDGEIILSTWDGDLPELPVDKLVLSKNPGKVHIHNVRRQITLAKAGVDEAKGEKILLTRTDVMHTVNCFESVEEGKIALLDFYAINPDFDFSSVRRTIKQQFVPQHRAFFKVSDFVQWGYAQEIKDWTSQKVKDLMFNYSKRYTFPTTVEQMWCVSFLQQRGYDVSIEKLPDSHDLRWSALIENFMFMTHREMGVSILKKKYRNLDAIRSRPWCLTSDLFKQNKNSNNDRGNMTNPHTVAWNAIKDEMLGEVCEVTRRVPWGFKAD